MRLLVMPGFTGHTCQRTQLSGMFFMRFAPLTRLTLLRATLLPIAVLVAIRTAPVAGQYLCQLESGNRSWLIKQPVDHILGEAALGEETHGFGFFSGLGGHLWPTLFERLSGKL